MTRLAAIWPALLFFVVAGLAGGVESGARFPHAALGLAAVVVSSLAGAAALADPLALGRGARLLPAALFVTVIASLTVAETPRAGLVGVLLLPSLLLLPAATARLVGDRSRRRLALAAWSVALSALAGWALAARTLEGEGWSGAPLGDRELLALVVASALPIAGLGWRTAGPGRWLAGVAVALGVATLVASRSLAGALALAAAAGYAAWRSDRGRDLLAGVALLALATAVPGATAAVRGESVAARERWALVVADWNAALERPWLGWGPGTAAWTEAAVRPALPGAEEATLGLGSPRALPSVLALELGLPALALLAALALSFALARRRAEVLDRGTRTAAFAGLAAGAVGLLAGAWQTTPALPVTLALAAGFALAAERRAPPPSRRWAIGLTLAHAVVAAWLATPLVVAAGSYDAARRSNDAAERAAKLVEAVELDPEFPLYRARAAWAGEREEWREAMAAARAARGAEPLWLRAATLANAAGEHEAARLAAAQALALDPLASPAAFLLHTLTPGDTACAARALLAEPRLAAAARWRGNERQRRRALERVKEWPGIDPRWRRDFYRRAMASPPGDGREQDLVIRLDGRPATATSVRLFRRPVWRAEILRMRIDRDAARRVAMRPATELASSSPDAFPARRCAPP